MDIKFISISHIKNIAVDEIFDFARNVSSSKKERENASKRIYLKHK